MKNNFSNFLEEDIKFRFLELFYIKTKVKDQEGTDGGKFLIRAGIVMLYSHWEGFTKESATRYLKEIIKLKLKINEMNSLFLEIFFSNNEYTKLGLLCRLYLTKVLFGNHLTSHYIVPKVDLKNNLKYGIFKKKCIQELCLNQKDFDSIFLKNIKNALISGDFFNKGTLVKYFKLDNNSLKEVKFSNCNELYLGTIDILVHYRNNIAHGKTDLSITYDQFTFIFAIVNCLLLSYKEILIDYFENKKYQK